MSTTVARKTGSATLVIEKFSEKTCDQNIALNINGFSNNHFGMHPKTVVFTYGDELVSIFLLNLDKFIFKYKANISILNLQKEKLFTKEYFGDFGPSQIAQNYFCLMPRSELLSPRNGYLFNDELTLLCELEVLEEGENKKDADAISKEFINLSENLQSLLTDGKLADATLVVGMDGKEFPVHKAILAARSPVFAAMFEHDCEEKRQNKVTITDMDEDVCGEMLRYLYTGEVKGLDQFAMELLVVADKYQLHSLKSICSQYMCNNLSVESVANVLILADLHQELTLKSKCFEYICANVEQVESTDGWKVLAIKGTLLQELFIFSKKN